MKKIIARKDFIRNGEYVFAGDELKINNIDELVKLNEKGFIEPLDFKEVIQIQKELKNNSKKKEEC